MATYDITDANHGVTVKKHKVHSEEAESSSFYLLFGSFLVGLMVLYGTCTQYGSTYAAEDAAGAANNVGTYYTFARDVSFMIFMGFGFLMTFLRKAGYSAVALNFLISCFVVLWAILVIGFVECVHHGHYTKIDLKVQFMIEGLFAAGSCMISFGAIIGKVSPSQCLVIAFFEVMFYGLDYYANYKCLYIVDIGGSIVIHTFGAYFGLAVAMVLCRKPNNGYQHPFNGPRTSSDLFAMIGTIVLWMCWPSFNGALADRGAQLRVIINTLLSLCCSCCFTFITSRLVSSHKRFDMVHIQNATLAGGVAIGAVADLAINPASAMAIGSIAGICSTVGFEKVLPLLNRRIGLDDTCGVHYLHGIPGLIGGFSAVIATAAADEVVYGQTFAVIFHTTGRDNVNQPGYQLAAIAICLAIAIGGGLFTGLLVKTFMSNPPRVMEDEPYFVVCDDYETVGPRQITVTHRPETTIEMQAARVDA
eukprot:GILK01001746.1.p1 GENE.GILK01001746.1~~GILK01001746.1.p1  ORF type:complete len:506 (+),score=74.18 GILK01001746.1:92-1519(+)